MTISVHLTGSKASAPYHDLSHDQQLALATFVKELQKAARELRLAGFTLSGTISHPAVDGRTQATV